MPHWPALIAPANNCEALRAQQGWTRPITAHRCSRGDRLLLRGLRADSRVKIAGASILPIHTTSQLEAPQSRPSIRSRDEPLFVNCGIQDFRLCLWLLIPLEIRHPLFPLVDCRKLVCGWYTYLVFKLQWKCKTNGELWRPNRETNQRLWQKIAKSQSTDTWC